MDINYLSGFNNQHQSEAKLGALPQGQNSPQQPAFGLYSEQINGTAFTVERANNLRSWLYRIRPSVLHGEFGAYKHKTLYCESDLKAGPTQLRWSPQPNSKKQIDFIDSLFTLAFNDASHGATIHLYNCNTNMQERYFYNADAEMVIIPQLGGLLLHTEMGVLECQPEEFAVIPRGIKFRVELVDESASGYVCENSGIPLRLPELGVIGANGLANPRDFLYPSAHYEELEGKFIQLCKYQGTLWQAPIQHSPLDVVAWHGNYAPYKYDLKNFNTINTVSFDHPDPSIFTVLTSPSAIRSVANLDFVIFPDRWMVAEHTFRPPYFHRNVMNEFMGLIKGCYDAKGEDFTPGGASIHNCMSAHGPDTSAYIKANNEKLKPRKTQGILAFMFESQHIWLPTKQAMSAKFRQSDYLNCWQGLSKNNK